MSNGIEKLNKVKISNQISEKIIEMIKNGDLKPNDKIPSEKELMTQFGVSRSSLREAMSSLAFLGFITISAGSGTKVTEVTDEMLARYFTRKLPINIGMIKQIQETRVILEEAIIALATDRATPGELKDITDHLESMKGHRNELDLAVQDDIAFHLAIANASHNTILVDLERQTRQMMSQYISQALKLPGVYDEVITQHQEIIDAMQTRRPDLARITLYRHLKLIGEKLIEVTEK